MQDKVDEYEKSDNPLNKDEDHKHLRELLDKANNEQDNLR